MIHFQHQRRNAGEPSGVSRRVMTVYGTRRLTPLGSPNRRHGFTLIELMVVIGIILALAAITLMFYPKSESRLAARGAEQLQTYIASARSRALRDQAPRGIRLISENGGFRSVQLVETPEPLAPPTSAEMTIAVPGNATDPSTATFTNFNPSTAGVAVGDFLEIIYGTGSIHRITAVTANSVALASRVPAAEVTALKLTNNYRFIRSPRPLMGEPPYQLPNGVFVMSTAGSDSNPGSLNIPSPTPSGDREIIFAPSGQVINASDGRIVLWLTDDNNVSKSTLLTIYTRTGGVAAHPAGSAGNLFEFTKDGRSSGQ